VNPIVGRELLDLFRTRKALAIQVGLALACALLVLVRWPTGGVGDLSGARSLEVLRVFGYGALAGVLLLTPAAPATAIVREKVKGTLALLLNSPLSAWSIYLGKLGGALGFTAVLLLMVVPAAAACHALGGTSVRGGVGLLFAVLALAAVQLATLGLLVSSRAQSADGALRTTYALVLAVCLLPLAPHWLVQGGPAGVTAVTGWLRALSPIPAVMEVLGQADVGTHGLTAGAGAVARYAVLAGAMSVACALATVVRLNHAALDRARPAGVLTGDRPRGQQVARRVLFLVDPQRRSKGIGDRVNPVMAKEFRTRRFGRSHWTLRLIALCAILSLGLSYVAASGALGWGVELMGGALVLLQIALLILVAPSLAAGLISAERESGSWQLLRLTPLSAGVILRGKLLSVAWPLLLLLGATLPGYLVMAFADPTLASPTLRVLVSLALTAVFAVLASAAAGSLFRSTAAATTASYLVLAAVGLVPLLVWLARGAPFGPRAVEAALTVSPVAAALRAANTPGFTDYALIPANWWLVGSASLALLAFLTVRTWHLYRPE
jgi:ABC-type transport system involved in multi-copper enzyme maturation permease subunit